MAYKRIMLKLSGEVLGGSEGGVDGQALSGLCDALLELTAQGLQLALVVGGGNIWRYRDNADLHIPRTASDTIGMMATVMNARVLAEALMMTGAQAHALAPFPQGYYVEPYSPNYAKELLSEGSIVICGGGTGNPYFTTDSTAALRALELDCEVLLKATKVDGVYDKDPAQHSDAQFFADLTYDEVLKRELGVMDLTAITLCKENKLPVRVFNVTKAGTMCSAALGEAIGTLIHN
jgi:uridylate kinase